MKTKIVLKASSMLFFGSINLLRNQEVEVDSTQLSKADIKVLNRFIKSGSITSTEGLIDTEEKALPTEATLESVEVKMAEEAPKVEEDVEEKSEELAPVPDEAPVEEFEAPKTVKKTTRKTASKKTA